MSDPTPAPTPTNEQAFEDRAMRQRTSLTNPSPLLLRVRQHVRDHGGDGKAFDWAVNDHVRAALGRVSAAAPDEREVLDFLDEMNTGGHISYGDYSHLHALINALAARPAPTHECEQEYGTDRDGCVVGPLPCRHPEHTRPAPVVSGECDHARAAREIARTTPLSLDAATALIDSLARGAATLADAWDEGYSAGIHAPLPIDPTGRNPYRTVAVAPAADDEGGRA